MLSGLLLGANLVVILQTTQATLTGTVADGVSGAPVHDAMVSLPDLNRAILTDSTGRYHFRSVPAGPQHVSVRRIGYEPRTIHAILPGAGELSVDIALQRLPARLSEVRVLSPPAIRGVEPDDKRPFGDRGISAAAIRNHPMLAEADGFLALGGGEVQMRPESPSGISIRGSASDQAAYLLDGIPILSPYHAAGTFSAINTDALERLDISAAFPPAIFPDALSGVVHAHTRTPGSALQLHGGMSTTHSRITMDGPIGRTGLGYLVSYRVGYPVNILPRKEASLLAGESGDIVAKLEGPLFGGRAKLLGFDTSNEFGAASTAEGEAPLPEPSSQNDYSWKSRSVGLQWSAVAGRSTYEVRIWSATSSAGMIWHTAADTSWRLASQRADVGLFASAERRNARGVTSVGTWLRAATTSYESVLGNSNSAPFSFDTQTPLGAIFARSERALAQNIVASVGLTASTTFSELHLNPSAMLTWSPSQRISISGSIGRLRQYTQSLRNPESAVSNIFPPDLFVGASAAGVPAARADQAAIAIAYQPGPGQRIGAQLFARGVHDVVLVAPRTGEPFATDGFMVGSGTARGAALEWALTRPRYGLMASYGVQSVRMRHGDAVYTPENGTSHSAEAGIVAFPSSTLSLRAGVALLAGRRSTNISGPFEWEACNLLDKGCEFGGSPRYDVDSIGKRRLPLYARLDIGVRKHWHLRIAGRDTPIAVYATATNLIDRANIMTFARDAATGQMVAVTMRPRSPLVLGIDWRY